MASSAPPFYESLLASISNPQKVTPEKLHNVVTTLHLSEQAFRDESAGEMLARSVGATGLTEEQKLKFAYGVVQYMSHPLAEIPIRMTASLAATGVQAVNASFTTLTTAVDGLDAKGIPPPEGNFGPRIRALHEKFRNTLQKSTKYALEVADYGVEFEDQVLKLAKDESLSVSDRIAKIVAFIQKADSISRTAQGFIQDFQNLKSELAIFTGSLSGWAKDKESQDNERLAAARNELEGLQSKLSKLQTAFTATASVAAASLPVTGILAILAGPFAPFVIIGGLAVAGVSTGATVGLSAEITSVKNDIESKKTEITKLEKEIQELKNTRTSAENTGKETLAVFDVNLTALELVMQSTKNDCTKIIEWLQQGKQDADMPLYMKISLDQAAGVYKALAKFLHAYADEIPK